MARAGVMDAADALLSRLDRDAGINRAETQKIRKELVRAGREDAVGAVNGLKTHQVGGARILIPTAKGYKDLDLMSRRIKQRTSQVRLRWLDAKGAKQLIEGPLKDTDPGSFIRGSHRLARNAHLFLDRIAELEPAFAEEIAATKIQIEDAKKDLISLELKSWKTIAESLGRKLGAEQRWSEAKQLAETYDIDRQLWNLSLHAHQDAVVRQILANASETMASKVTTKASEIPKRAYVFAGLGPEGERRVIERGPNSATANMSWRVFTASKLDKFFATASALKTTVSTWRGLGLHHNSPEWYVPFPEEDLDEVTGALEERRAQFMEEVRAN